MGGGTAACPGLVLFALLRRLLMRRRLQWPLPLLQLNRHGRRAWLLLYSSGKAAQDEAPAIACNAVPDSSIIKGRGATGQGHSCASLDLKRRPGPTSPRPPAPDSGASRATPPIWSNALRSWRRRNIKGARTHQVENWQARHDKVTKVTKVTISAGVMVCQLSDASL